ncbi:class I SAM-dependent methyltransferase [Candidatus Woesearchaeota archaeon]|nr:class I SAM-dependent methyltransferase [Candidatus Woesearchaeota archaeon]HIH38706.1 class I SAM-dependent methyltransferase [Candidatus Woesearchaeota archaeon]HIH49759.1 class I SAM-dependent methyltransferase [Candidatus Woesearchaeota archaeon]HIJ03590.1 class I SAM-dependent methyltransferase [Candidatus Woesearchaeota archaeon]
MGYSFDIQFEGYEPTPNYPLLLRRLGLESPEELKGKSVLEVGCGHGLNVVYLAKHGAIMTGLDLSKKIDELKEKHKDISWVKSDILEYKPKERFDLVFCIGVLHHTPDPAKFFDHLSTFVRLGGKLVVWVYHKFEMNVKAMLFWRKVVKRLHISKRTFHRLCYLGIPMSRLQTIKLFRPLNILFPVHVGKGLDKKYIQYSTYDMYIHEYNSFHTYPEVYGWFVKNNFSDIELEEIPVCVRGIKSSRGSGKEKKSA